MTTGKRPFRYPSGEAEMADVYEAMSVLRNGIKSREQLAIFLQDDPSGLNAAVTEGENRGWIRRFLRRSSDEDATPADWYELTSDGEAKLERRGHSHG